MTSAEGTVWNATIQENNNDLETLSKNKYQLQVAKSVSSPGSKPKFNVVYKSQTIVANVDVYWTTQYGLNWTTSIPNPGAEITFAGVWQLCELGQSCDHIAFGGWALSNDNPHKDENSLNVGVNCYQPVNIVVGTQDPKTN